MEESRNRPSEYQVNLKTTPQLTPLELLLESPLIFI
tara:strand:- start:1027 stop:1134 length:108 start_codon:yes stop_codon:yes gene_type:complete